MMRHSWAYSQRFSPLRSTPRKQASSLTNSSLHSKASNKEILHITPTINAVRASANIVTGKHVLQNKAPVQMFLFHSPFFLWLWPILERLRGQQSGGHDYQKSDITKHRRPTPPLPYLTTQTKRYIRRLQSLYSVVKKFCCFRLACWGLKMKYFNFTNLKTRHEHSSTHVTSVTPLT